MTENYWFKHETAQHKKPQQNWQDSCRVRARISRTHILSGILHLAFEIIFLFLKIRRVTYFGRPMLSGNPAKRNSARWLSAEACMRVLWTQECGSRLLSWRTLTHLKTALWWCKGTGAVFLKGFHFQGCEGQGVLEHSDSGSTPPSHWSCAETQSLLQAAAITRRTVSP